MSLLQILKKTSLTLAVVSAIQTLAEAIGPEALNTTASSLMSAASSAFTTLTHTSPLLLTAAAAGALYFAPPAASIMPQDAANRLHQAQLDFSEALLHKALADMGFGDFAVDTPAPPATSSALVPMQLPAQAMDTSSKLDTAQILVTPTPSTIKVPGKKQRRRAGLSAKNLQPTPAQDQSLNKLLFTPEKQLAQWQDEHPELLTEQNQFYLKILQERNSAVLVYLKAHQTEATPRLFPDEEMCIWAIKELLAGRPTHLLSCRNLAATHNTFYGIGGLTQALAGPLYFSHTPVSLLGRLQQAFPKLYIANTAPVAPEFTDCTNGLIFSLNYPPMDTLPPALAQLLQDNDAILQASKPIASITNPTLKILNFLFRSEQQVSSPQTVSVFFEIANTETPENPPTHTP